MNIEERWCWPRHEALEIEAKHDEPAETTSSQQIVSAYSFRSHSSSDGAFPACRICLQADEDVVEAGCACAGTQRWVHVECLNRWRMSGDLVRRRQCEICRMPYSTRLETEHYDGMCIKVFSLSLLLLDIVNLVFSFWIDEDSPPYEHAFVPLSTSLWVSSFLKLIVVLHVVCALRRMQTTVLVCLGVNAMAIVCEYDEFWHAATNLSFHCLLLGAVAE